jgi:hypothetical protein
MHAFHPWVRLDEQKGSAFGQDLPLWLPDMVGRCIVDISFVAGVCSGGLNLYFRTESQAWVWYAASLGFTMAHLVFSKEALRQLKSAWNVHAERQTNLDSLQKWLRMNKIRFWMSEVPAFITAVMAVLLSLEAP